MITLSATARKFLECQVRKTSRYFSLLKFSSKVKLDPHSREVEREPSLLQNDTAPGASAVRLASRRGNRKTKWKIYYIISFLLQARETLPDVSASSAFHTNESVLACALRNNALREPPVHDVTHSIDNVSAQLRGAGYKHHLIKSIIKNVFSLQRQITVMQLKGKPVTAFVVKHL